MSVIHEKGTTDIKRLSVTAGMISVEDMLRLFTKIKIKSKSKGSYQK